MIRVVLGLVLGLAPFTLARAQSPECPCKYTVPGLEYTTSRKPIPPAHARCLRPINELIGWYRANQESGGMAHSILESNLNNYSRLDWGVPTRDSARGMLARSTRDLPKSEADLAKARRGLEEAKRDAAKRPATKQNAPKQEESRQEEPASEEEKRAAVRRSQTERLARFRRGVENLTRYSEDLARAEYLLAESSLRNNKAFAAYAQCVVNNNLPPTEN